MLKTLCLLALIATISFAQDAPTDAPPADAPVDVPPVDVPVVSSGPAPLSVDVVDQALTDAGNFLATADDASISQAAQDIVQNLTSGAPGVNPAELPLLNQVNITWGTREVVLTPLDWDSTDANWLNNWEHVDVEKVNVDSTDDEEWGWAWSVENGADWALWDQDDSIWLVSNANGTWNPVSNLGSDDVLEPQLAASAQQIVNSLWDSNQNNLTSEQLGQQVGALIVAAVNVPSGDNQEPEDEEDENVESGNGGIEVEVEGDDDPEDGPNPDDNQPPTDPNTVIDNAVAESQGAVNAAIQEALASAGIVNNGTADGSGTDGAPVGDDDTPVLLDDNVPADGSGDVPSE